MFKMSLWQYAVVGVVAVICVGYMGVAITRMFSRDAGSTAELRDGTAFESGLATAAMPAGAYAVDGFSYRVPARYAGRVRLVVAGDRVSVTGPRAPKGAYVVWIWVQGLLLALVPAVFVMAAVKLDWKIALLALALFAVNLAFSSLGAGLWPALGEMSILEKGALPALEFSSADVHDVKVGPGWADGGIDVVLLPVKGGIDALSVGRAVSFFAPDEDGRDVRYAIHTYSEADATALAAALGGENGR
ncbi:MAG: hypothetical protein ACYC77_03695 [Coriobacteriia bacterium]